MQVQCYEYSTVISITCTRYRHANLNSIQKINKTVTDSITPTHWCLFEERIKSELANKENGKKNR